MVAKAIMFQGTGSDVGKSLIVAGLARLLANRGYRVKPFKPQNMSNNAAVTVDGGEIGRAQALQAKAARVAPTVDMNPILLKPQSQTGAQVVVRGRVLTSAKARDYQKLKPTLLEPVLESFSALKNDADFVLVEGAGSASEINLRENDIANMGFARRAGVPVVLVGDIDRGGVIASLVGTQAVVESEDAALIRGFIINRMRGDISLFQDGVAAIADKTGWQSIGIVPHFDEAHKLPAEDALALRDQSRWQVSGDAKVRIAVLSFQHIANFDDVDPLQQDPNIDLMWVQVGDAIPAGVDLVILPGSKATMSDLGQLYSEGWDVDLRAHARRGGAILGLCGGYQMLGETLSDPEGIEGPAGSQQGLGLLPVSTTMSRDKKLVSVKGNTLNDGLPFEGYEMHMGQTTLQDGGLPMVKFSDGRTEGAVSPCGLISGTYAHGFFANDRQRAAWVKRLSGQEVVLSSYDAQVEAALDGLAKHFEQHLDIESLIAIAQS